MKTTKQQNFRNYLRKQEGLVYSACKVCDVGYPRGSGAQHEAGKAHREKTNAKAKLAAVHGGVLE